MAGAEPLGSARACAVVGSPIGHSLSPVLHRAAYDDLGLDDWTYGRLEVPAGTLATVASGLAADGLGGLPCGGLSVTMPGKIEALALATGRSDATAAIGAANTLVPICDVDSVVGWTAYNTDVDGIIGALREAGLALIQNQRALVVGAGGTASAAIAALKEIGARRVCVVARNRTRAQPVVDAASAVGVDLELRDWDAATSLVAAADVVISTVPLGAADALAQSEWRRGAVLLDAVYAGGDTRLMRAADAAGVRVVGGRVMLLHQAVEQVRLMTGLQPDVAVMRAALDRA